MITVDSFVVENGRFQLKDKPNFDLTTQALRQALTQSNMELQPEEGTNYTNVCEDLGRLGGRRDILFAYVQDGTSGENKYSVRLQNKGHGREDPPTLISFARFNQQEVDLILQYI